MSDATKEDIRERKSEKFTTAEEQSSMALHTRYLLPYNISDMRQYAFGKMTWRDVIVSSIVLALCIGFGYVVFTPFIGSALGMLIGVLLAIYPVFLVNKHSLTGEPPIEDRIRIYLDAKDHHTTMCWDKQRTRSGLYESTSTQSVVPDVSFGDDDTQDNFVYVNGDHGGFSVLSVEPDDESSFKENDKLSIFRQFQNMLNSLATERECIPIQLVSHAEQMNLSTFVENAEEDVRRIGRDVDERQRFRRPLMESRAEDYQVLVAEQNSRTMFTHRYYVVVTYRDDSEDIGSESITKRSAQLRRQKMLDKANPLKKSQDRASNIEFDIGDDREAKVSAATRENKWTRRKTQAALLRRTTTVMDRLSSIGPTPTCVRVTQLDRMEIAKLFYACYNTVDKETVDAVVSQALDQRPVQTSQLVYDDFPDLFPQTVVRTGLGRVSGGPVRKVRNAG